MNIQETVKKWFEDHPDAKECHQVLYEFFSDPHQAATYLRSRNAKKITTHKREDFIKTNSESENLNP
jgi:hypothetical protein